MGHWIICGNDALGKTLKRYLDYEGVDCTIIDPDLPTAPGQVRGIGTEAVTLREARIDRAQAIVAAYKSDPDNLSIAVTAKTMHPSLFVVGKQTTAPTSASSPSPGLTASWPKPTSSSAKSIRASHKTC